MIKNIEITVVTSNLLPGYDDEGTLGPFEKIVSDGIDLLSPQLRNNANISHWNRFGVNTREIIGCNNCVSIIDRDNFNIVWQRPMSGLTSVQVKNALEYALQLTYDPSTQSYTTPGGQTVDAITPGDGTANGGGFFPGFGLFNLPVNLPNWVWWALAAGSAYKASESRVGGQLLWSALGVVSMANAINKK